MKQQENSEDKKRFCRQGLPSADGFRMPAEFEPHHGCVMIWPKRPGSWPYGAKEAKRIFAQIAAVISQSEKLYMLADAELVPEAYDYLNRAYRDMEKSLLLIAANSNCKKTIKAGLSKADDDSDGIKFTINAADGRAVMEILPIESDDAWARDVAPTFVSDNKGGLRGISWQFNAWGGEYDGLYAHWEKDDALAAQFCSSLGISCYDAAPFVLEGGSIHSDGEGTVLVTEACLLSPGRNPSLSKSEIEQKLKAYLGAQKVLWLPHGIYGDETNEHVDNICAFVRPGEVVLAWTDDETDPQYAYSSSCMQILENETDAKGRRIKVHKLYIPEKPVCITKDDLPGYIYEEGETERQEGERLAASYVNFYIANRNVIVPQFGDVRDRSAVELLARLFPERTIVPIYARGILLGGGNIHCITQQIPQRV